MPNLVFVHSAAALPCIDEVVTLGVYLLFFYFLTFFTYPDRTVPRKNFVNGS